MLNVTYFQLHKGNNTFKQAVINSPFTQFLALSCHNQSVLIIIIMGMFSLQLLMFTSHPHVFPWIFVLLFILLM